jgi:hypothetical protein
MYEDEITPAQLDIVNGLTDLIVNHSVEDILKGVAHVCRMGEKLHTNMNDHARSGDYAHYADTIEKLFEN